MESNDAFRTNQPKADARVRINAFMMGSLFLVLTFMWTETLRAGGKPILPVPTFWWIYCQLVLAIPVLFVSSLAYAKVGYWNEAKKWDKLGWFTCNLGNILILNGIGLMASVLSGSIAWIYFSVLVCLMVCYTYINISLAPTKKGNRILKFVFFVIVLFVGGILPLLLGV